jgi:hypothetical protein
MKKSNLIISAIALTILGVVIVCLTAYKERPEWKAEKKLLRSPVVERQAIEKMTAFAARCSQVEELVLESSVNLRGRVLVTDSSQFSPASNGEVKIDTLLESGGKKLTLRIEPKADAQIIYYDIQLLLPLVNTIRLNNGTLDLETKKQGLHISVKGESYCNINGFTPAGTQVDITDLSTLYFLLRSTKDSVQIKASGNAIVNTQEEMGKLMQQNGDLILTQNAVIRNN